jgi:hypothetical protein
MRGGEKGGEEERKEGRMRGGRRRGGKRVPKKSLVAKRVLVNDPITLLWLTCEKVRNQNNRHAIEILEFLTPKKIHKAVAKMMMKLRMESEKSGKAENSENPVDTEIISEMMAEPVGEKNSETPSEVVPMELEDEVPRAGPIGDEATLGIFPPLDLHEKVPKEDLNSGKVSISGLLFILLHGGTHFWKVSGMKFPYNSSTGHQNNFLRLFSDITLTVSGVSIPCHKIILATNSEYFMNLFSHMSEKNLPEIEIKEVDPEKFKKVLDALYSPNLEIFSESDFFGLLEVADMFQVVPILRELLKLLPQIISEENFGVCLEWLDRYDLFAGMAEYKNDLLHWVIQNWELFVDKEKQTLLFPHLRHFSFENSKSVVYK